jgi:ferrous iron transport protein A
MEPFLPLELLNPGEWADVGEVTGQLAWVARMAELGIRAGARIQVLRGGSPCLVLVGSSRLSLRGDHAMQILVRPILSTPATEVATVSRGAHTTPLAPLVDCV